MHNSFLKFIIILNLLKGLAYTIAERKRLGIHGLYPPVFQDQETQERLVLENLHRINEDIDKYTYLMHLLDRFYFNLELEKKI